MRSVTRLLLLFAASTALVVAANPDSQLAYLGAWPHQVIVFDAAKEKIVDRIELKTDVPRSLVLSPDHKKLYVSTLNDNAIVTIDLATNKVTDSFSLNTPGKNYRLSGLTTDPAGHFLYGVAVTITKQIDHYDVDPPKFAVIDLTEKKIVRWGDFPKDDVFIGYRVAMKASPDGKYLYLFRNNITVFETATFKVVKKMDLAKPPVSGMENLSLSMVEDPNEIPGMMTSVFNSSDSYVHREIFGIAQVNLSNLTFDFTPVGPATTAMMSLMLTPDRKVGYTVAINGLHGNRRCEFWAFDMQTKKLINKRDFDGRTRFYFGLSADGTKLFIYGAGYQIEVYDAKTLQLRSDIDTPGDITTNMVVLPLPKAALNAASTGLPAAATPAR